ncbi:MAG: hypothetical protein IJV31_03755 [Clostridia bacterium]|nr:hypothetical protein [Clostridia bacterium]
MKKVGFIGGCDKSDLIMYVASILSKMQKKVLVLDATRLQKIKYIIPKIEPAASYITEFEKIDVAIGFRNISNVEEYLGEKLKYDIVLIDIDTARAIKENYITNVDLNYFVSTFDMYSLKKGIEILGRFEQPLNLTRILYDIEPNKEDEEYLNFLSLGKKVVWTDEIIYFLQENGDSRAIMNNQRLGKIKFSNMSSIFKENIAYIVQQIDDGATTKQIKTIIKNSD